MFPENGIIIFMTFLETYQLIKEDPDEVTFDDKEFTVKNEGGIVFFIGDDFLFCLKEKKANTYHHEIIQDWIEYAELYNEVQKMKSWSDDRELERETNKLLSLKQDLEEKYIIHHPPVGELDPYIDEDGDILSGRLFDVGDGNYVCSIWGNLNKLYQMVQFPTFKLMLNELGIDIKKVYFEDYTSDYNNPRLLSLEYLMFHGYTERSNEDAEKEKKIIELKKLLHTASDYKIKKWARNELKKLGVQFKEGGTDSKRDPLYWNYYSRMSESVEN